MLRLPPVRAIAIDVLGTLVDEPAALRAAIRDVRPDLSGAEVERFRLEWEQLTTAAQNRMLRGERPFTDADALDAEIAEVLAQRLRVADPSRLARAHRMLTPWPYAVDGVRMLAERHPVFALSNATGETLQLLADRVGFSWNGVLSAEQAGAYKPDPAIYRLVGKATGASADEILMVAAHAWDLRAAQRIGLRTAYVRRPVGDLPDADDSFDGEFAGLNGLADALARA